MENQLKAIYTNAVTNSEPEESNLNCLDKIWNGVKLKLNEIITEPTRVEQGKLLAPTTAVVINNIDDVNERNINIEENEIKYINIKDNISTKNDMQFRMNNDQENLTTTGDLTREMVNNNTIIIEKLNNNIISDNIDLKLQNQETNNLEDAGLQTGEKDLENYLLGKQNCLKGKIII